MSEPAEPREQWRPVPGYEGSYDVSNFGRVYSHLRWRGVVGRLLSPTVDRKGYPTICVKRDDGRWKPIGIHTLVMRAFVGPRPPAMQVRHLDGDPTNNHLANLRYGTQSENVQDSLRHGTHARQATAACPSGHEYTEANIRRIPSRPAARYCRACDRLRGKGSREAA